MRYDVAPDGFLLVARIGSGGCVGVGHNLVRYDNSNSKLPTAMSLSTFEGNSVSLPHPPDAEGSAGTCPSDSAVRRAPHGR